MSNLGRLIALRAPQNKGAVYEDLLALNPLLYKPVRRFAQ